MVELSVAPAVRIIMKNIIVKIVVKTTFSLFYA